MIVGHRDCPLERKIHIDLVNSPLSRLPRSLDSRRCNDARGLVNRPDAKEFDPRVFFSTLLECVGDFSNGVRSYCRSATGEYWYLTVTVKTHLERGGVPVRHQVADQSTIVGELLGAILVAGARCLDDIAVVAHYVDQSDESVVEDWELVAFELFEGGHCGLSVNGFTKWMRPERKTGRNGSRGNSDLFRKSGGCTGVQGYQRSRPRKPGTPAFFSRKSLARARSVDSAQFRRSIENESGGAQISAEWREVHEATGRSLRSLQSL